MSQAERIFRIERMLRTRAVVPIGTFLSELEISRATFNRDLEFLRDWQNAPIVYDKARRGYCLGDPQPNAPRHELPGLWFNSHELHALLAFHHFLEHLEPGLLSPHIEPLKERIEKLLEGKDQAPKEVTRRIRILPQATRHTEPAAFQQVAHALLNRRRLHLAYHGRARDAISERTVSPQRLVHYRDNWYLDAWDHGKRALRTFALERIRTPRILGTQAKDIPELRLDRHFATGYGIFAGKPKRKALLRFTPERTRWVAEERWHPEQKGRYDGNHYLLEIPYSDDRELVLDILKYGPEVEVIAPASLRREVAERLHLAAQRYNDTEKQR